MVKSSNETIRCHGCVHFYITHEPKHPYGCQRFGFKSKKLPSMLVVETTGTQCAYRVARESVRMERTQN